MSIQHEGVKQLVQCQYSMEYIILAEIEVAHCRFSWMCHWMYISVSVRLVERGHYPILLNISVPVSLFHVPCLHFDSFIHVSYIMYITDAAMLGMVRLEIYVIKGGWRWGALYSLGAFLLVSFFVFCFIKHSWIHLYLPPPKPTATTTKDSRNLFYINSFTATACTTFRIKRAPTSLQNTMFSGPITNLFSIIIVHFDWNPFMSLRNGKKKRLKTFEFHTVIGSFPLTSWQRKG